MLVRRTNNDIITNKTKVWSPQPPKITFGVSRFIERELEGLVDTANINRNAFIQDALRDFINSYRQLELEPFEMEHWYSDEGRTFNRRYTVTLTRELAEEFERLKMVYQQNNLQLNKSYLVRCALTDRIYDFINEAENG
ncbi:MAG: hypothetical protein NC200_00830 [Candidatus Gastranaerophilales bacterium]|nr:hypothetical protein [Candidatus Gastranaerophilales bacterium]